MDTVCPRLLDSPTLLCMLSPQLSTTVYIPSTARGRLRPSPTTDTLPEFILPCTTLVSTTVLSDIPDIIPMSTARGRLRPSPTTDTLPEFTLPCTTLVSTTVLSDMPDIIPMSTARGRLRPSPSTVTPPELSLTCTTLVSSLPLVSDTLSP